MHGQYVYLTPRFVCGVVVAAAEMPEVTVTVVTDADKQQMKARRIKASKEQRRRSVVTKFGVTA